jgi:hypothetical protein
MCRPLGKTKPVIGGDRVAELDIDEVFASHPQTTMTISIIKGCDN